jgi:hypothetical protein
MNWFTRANLTLLGRPLSPPTTLSPDSIPAGVVLREGRLIPWIGGVLGRMGGPAAAVTLRRTIVVSPGAPLTTRLLAHELTHVRQWSEDPLFPVRYALATLRHGYHANPYEVEARAVEAGLPAGELAFAPAPDPTGTAPPTPPA